MFSFFFIKLFYESFDSIEHVLGIYGDVRRTIFYVYNKLPAIWWSLTRFSLL